MNIVNTISKFVKGAIFEASECLFASDIKVCPSNQNTPPLNKSITFTKSYSLKLCNSGKNSTVITL